MTDQACVPVCAYVCVCVSVCLCLCAVVCAVDIQSKHCGFDPRRVRFTLLSSPSLPLGGYQQPKCVCLSMHGGQKKEKKRKKRNCRWPKTATGSCVVQDQAPQQWWSIRSALQPDRWCNSGTSTMLAHSRAIIAYGVPRSKICVCMCMSVYMCVCVCVCVCVCMCVCLPTPSCAVSYRMQKVLGHAEGLLALRWQ